MMRVVHCYGQTPKMVKAIVDYYEAERQRTEGEVVYPKYDKYEKGRSWQPTVCGLRAPDTDVVRPKDFVAIVNQTDPNVDQNELAVALEHQGQPYLDGDVVPDAVPCAECKEAAPKSWPALRYFSKDSE